MRFEEVKECVRETNSKIALRAISLSNHIMCGCLKTLHVPRYEAIHSPEDTKYSSTYAICPLLTALKGYPVVC
jgi:hypothetical protein